MAVNRVLYIFALLFPISLCSATVFTGCGYAEERPEILVFDESSSDVDALLFSFDGHSLISGANGIVIVWNLTTGTVEKTVIGKRLRAVVQSVERTKLLKLPRALTSRYDFDIWDFQVPYRDYDGHRIESFPQIYEAYIKTLFSPDGKQALRGYFVLHDNSAEGPVRFQRYGDDFLENIFKQNRGRVWFWYPGLNWKISGDAKWGGPQRVLRSPDGKYSLIGSYELMDLSTGKKICNFDDIGCPGMAVFSPDGRYVLFTNENSNKTRHKMWKGEIKGFYPFLLDVETGKERRFEGEGHVAPIESVAISPDSEYVISGSRDYTLKLWNIKTGKEIRTFEGHSASVTAIAFSPDGQHFVSGSDDNTLRLWDMDSEQEMGIFQSIKEYKDSFTIALFSPDGRYVISSNNRFEIMLWDVAEQKETVFVNAGKKIRSIVFLPSGKYVLTGHEDGYLKMWETEALKLIATMSAFDDGEWVVFTPEGYFSTSPEGDKHLKIRAGRSVYSIKKFYDRFYNPALVAKKLSGKKLFMAHDIRRGVAKPPTVRIVTPKKGETFAENKIKVVVKAIDQGGGIDEVCLYQNACAVGGAERGFTVKEMENGVYKTFSVRLVPGRNILKTIGFSKERTESGSHEIRVEYKGGQKEIDLHLVVIGINEYKNPSMHLNFAVADAHGLKDFFEKKWKNLFNDLHLVEIYDREATKENIIKTLSTMGSKEQDVVLVFLAGHGLNIGDEWFFLPYDVVFPEKERHVMERGLSSIEIKEMIMNNRSLKKALLIDSCKSGGMVLALSRSVEDRRAIAQLARSTGTHVVAASTDTQMASEVSQLGHGVFTYALLKGLGGQAGNQDATVTVRELIAYIEQNLPGISEKYRQKLQYPVVDSRGQDFPLVIYE